MKKSLLLILLICAGIFMNGRALAQDAPDWASVVKEIKGDIVVVKSTTESDFFNTIRTAVLGDTTATGERTNPNRIYETVPGEYYISDVSLDLDARVPDFVLTAPLPKDGGTPPIHVRALKPDASKDKTFMSSPGNIYVENQYYCGTFLDDSFESEFTRQGAIGSRLVVNNCIFDLSRWVISIPTAKHVTYKFTNCTFMAIGHEASIEKGLMIETRSLPPDTVWFENNTVINCGGFVMSLEHSAPTFGYFNHNTIVNTTQAPFIFHSAAEVVVANNLFVNAGLVPDYPGFYPLFDDDDHMPKGIVNIDTCEVEWQNNYWDGAYPVAEADRKFLFKNNSAWWDPRFEDMVAKQMTPIDPAVLPDAKWASQMMLMNDRTKAMFDDNAAYPYFNEGNNISVEPDFARNEDLVDEWIEFVVTNCVAGAPNKGIFVPIWRTNYLVNQYMIDWPMLPDLSYTNGTLKTAALNGHPLGDLNWFPAEKEKWAARGKESDVLIEALKSGKDPKVGFDKVTNFNKNIEVYPNPLTNNATVKFELSSSSNVEMSVFNLAGEKVRSTNLGNVEAGVNEVSFVKGNLNAGMYFIQLNVKSNHSIMVAKVSIK